MTPSYDSEGESAAAALADHRARHDGSQAYWAGLGLAANPYDAGTGDWLRWTVQWEGAATSARRDLMTQESYLRGRIEVHHAVRRGLELLDRVHRQWAKPPPSLALEIRAVLELLNRVLTRLETAPATPSGASGRLPAGESDAPSKNGAPPGAAAGPSA